jgi:hypothetical protein
MGTIDYMRLHGDGAQFFSQNQLGTVPESLAYSASLPEVAATPLVLHDRQQQLLCTEPEDLDADAEQQKSRDPHDDAGTSWAE